MDNDQEMNLAVATHGAINGPLKQRHTCPKSPSERGSTRWFARSPLDRVSQGITTQQRC